MSKRLNEMLLAKGWYLFSAGGAVFLLPYLYPFISSRGFSDPQIGLLAAVRPWLAAVAAMTGPALADRFNCHRAMMVATFLASILLRASIYYAAEAQYLVLFTVVIVSEYLAAPPNVLADAAVVALCSRQEGASYGRQRLWGSIGWGGLSFVAGVLLDSCGYGSGFLVYLVLSAPCIYVLARFSYGSSGGSSSSSHGRGDKGAGGSSRRGGKAASIHRGAEVDGSAAHAAVGSEEEALCGEAQLSTWPPPPGSMLHEEALLPHVHEPFPFIRTLVRTISGPPPTTSPPSGPRPRRRRPASPQPKPFCSSGDCGSACQQSGGLVAFAAHLPPPELMHLATPFGYEDAQHPRGGASAALAVAAVAAEEPGTPMTASDGSSHGGGSGGQRYSMMKLSSSVEAWIERSETWIRQRECERSATAAAVVATASSGGAIAVTGAELDGNGGMVRAGACLGSPSVSGRCGGGIGHAAGIAFGGDAEGDGGEADLLLGPMPAAQPSVAAAAGGGGHHVHLVATIRDPRPVATAAAGASPDVSYHIHVSANGAAADAVPFGAGPKMGSATTLGSTAATGPSTPSYSGKRQQCPNNAAGSGSGHSAAGAAGVDGGGFLVRAGRLLSNGAVWLFLAKVFLLGFGTGTIGTWLFIYVSSLGASHALQGLMLTMNCVAEVPVFFFQEAVTRRFPAGAVLHVATGSLVLRLAAYVALPSLPSPWFVLPVELMQGLTFALSWGTCCVHCKAIAPESLQATMQGLWQAMFNGLASGAGGLVGAVLHDRLGGRAMFAITAGLILAGWLLLAAAEGLAALAAARRRRRAGSGPRDECVHLMKGEADSTGRGGGSSGSGGACGFCSTRQCEVVVAAGDNKRALLAGADGLSSPALGRSGSGRGQAARALGRAAGASVSYVLRLALAGAWRHGFHAASAAAAAAASATSGTAPGQQGASVLSSAAESPPSYDEVADDMTHGGLLYGFFSRRRMGSIAGSLSGRNSSGGAGSGASSPKQGLMLPGGGGEGSRRGLHARGGSAAALTPEAPPANAGAISAGGGRLERRSSDVAFDGGRDQGLQQEELAAARAAQGSPAPPAAVACSAGASGSSGDSGGSAMGSGSSGMLDALGLAAAAAASLPMLPASPAAAASWQ